MTPTKSEITLKFNELPQATPAPNKKVEIELTDQNGVVFTALINAKSYRKAEGDVATFTEWGGAITGKLGSKTELGFDVVDAGIKVFEKKAKDQAPSASTVNPEAVSVS